MHLALYYPFASVPLYNFHLRKLLPPGPAHKFAMSILTLSNFSFLITYEFWSRIGFLISYVVTSFLVLEVLRLVYTDVNKREVEKFLEGYAKQRTVSPRRSQETRKVSLEELERPCTPPSRPIRDTTPESERTLVNEERRRRRAQSAASTSPVHGQVQAQAQIPTPPRRLRKRSDTVSSSESKSPLRRRREVSPASEAGSKASSRQGSPLRRIKKREDVALGIGLGGGLRRTKVSASGP